MYSSLRIKFLGKYRRKTNYLRSTDCLARLGRVFFSGDLDNWESPGDGHRGTRTVNQFSLYG